MTDTDNKRFRTIKGDLVECERGWQVECAVTAKWTLHSPVYATKAHARKVTNAVAQRLGITIELDDTQ